MVRRLKNHLADLATTRDQVQARIDKHHREIARAGEQLDQPFARRDELVDAKRRLRAVDAVIDLLADDTTTPYTAPPPAVPVTVGDWMPALIRDGLDPDQQAWLDQLVHSGR